MTSTFLQERVVERIPPSAVDAEMAVIGSVLVDREMMDVVYPLVQPSHFYAMRHEAIFAAMVDLFERREPMDKITVCDALRVRKRLDEVGGAPYLSQLMETVPTAANAAYFAQIVRDKAVLRAMIRAGTQLTAAGFECEGDVEQAIATAEQLLRSVTMTDRKPGRGARSYGEIIAGILRSWDEQRDDRVPTPWPTLEALTGGAYPGELWLWVAAAAMGKTGVVGQLSDYIAATTGPVLLWAIEMGGEAMVRRGVALHADGVTAREQRSREMTAEQRERMFDTLGELQDAQIYVLEQPQNRLSDLRRELRRLERTVRPRALIVDHIGFIAEARSERKNDALDQVYKDLIQIAKEFELVVHAVQHVNREGMKGKPSMRDIRDGGNPEGNAHVIVFPYRQDPSGQPEVGEFIVAKNRDGVQSAIDMRYIGRRHLWLDVQAGQDRPWFEMGAPVAESVPFWDGP
jgi:replicative DNA helicase